MPEPHVTGASRALLVSPDSRMVAELRHLLGRELPLTALSVAEDYPNRAKLVELVSAGVQLCFLDLDSDRAAAFAAMSLAAATFPDLPVLALLRSSDPDLILRCLREGAAEFLMEPFSPEQLNAALSKISRLRAPRTAGAESNSRIYCVMPGKASCGATTVACHLAFALKRGKSDTVLLADLDWMTGTMGFLLKLKSSYSFADALAHAGALDADLWKALVTPCHGVDVLLSPEQPAHGFADTADPSPILNYSRKAYSAVVLDAGGTYGPWNAALARLCDELLIVTTNELAALHSVQRAQAYLERHGSDPSKMRVIVNRDHSDVGLPREGVEAALQAPVFAVLPADSDAIQKSIIEGKPAAPGSRFGKAVSRLAGQLTGRDGASIEKKAAGSLFSALLKKLTG